MGEQSELESCDGWLWLWLWLWLQYLLAVAVPVGTSGTIEGWADLGQREALLKVIVDHPSGPKHALGPASPKNLKLASLEMSKAGSEVKAEPEFKTLVADRDNKATKVIYLKSRIGVSLQALTESLPTCTDDGDKDLVVVALEVAAQQPVPLAAALEAAAHRRQHHDLR